MPGLWTDDQSLLNSIVENLAEAVVLLPKKLLHMDEIVHQHNMPFSHIQILVMLAEGERSISRISSALGIAKPNITPLLDSLSTRGLVERIRSEEDRRIVNVRLTEAGTAQLNEIYASVAQQVNLWGDRMSRSDAKRLNNALAEILNLTCQLTGKE